MTPVYLDTQWWVVTTSTCLDTATIVAVDVTRGTATSITLFDQDLSFQKLPTDYEKLHFPWNKSMLKVIISNVAFMKFITFVFLVQPLII